MGCYGDNDSGLGGVELTFQIIVRPGRVNYRDHRSLLLNVNGYGKTTNTSMPLKD